MIVATSTELPKLVRPRCVIEVFGSVFGSSLYFLEFSVGIRAISIDLSQISSCFWQQAISAVHVFSLYQSYTDEIGPQALMRRKTIKI